MFMFHDRRFIYNATTVIQCNVVQKPSTLNGRLYVFILWSHHYDTSMYAKPQNF